jgi:hypothetical protein
VAAAAQSLVAPMPRLKDPELPLERGAMARVRGGVPTVIGRLASQELARLRRRCSASWNAAVRVGGVDGARSLRYLGREFVRRAMPGWYRDLPRALGVRNVDNAVHIRAVPRKRVPQEWHKDYDGDVALPARVYTVFVYLTEVTPQNGITEFLVNGVGRGEAERAYDRRRQRVATLPGPAGTVVAFLGNATLHRGLGNGTRASRDVLALTLCDVVTWSQ